MDSDSLPYIPHKHVPHYHGDVVRVLFIAAAVVMIIAESTGAILPLSVSNTVAFAVVLVVAAGITNPAQKWIHWINAAISIYGAYLFGTTAIEHYRVGGTLFDSSYLSTEILAILFLFAIYYAVKTVRGLLIKVNLS